MQFTAIKYDGETVGLKWEEQRGEAIDKHDWSCDEPPTPAFKAALAAFTGFVVGLIEAPKEWANDLEVRQLALHVEKGGERGIVITALRKCPKAKNRTLLINSPYMTEAPIDYNGPLNGYLPSTVLDFIEDAEAEAEKYLEGERGEQVEMPLESENAKAAGEKMAEAEVASTRKPGKKGKKKDVTPDFELLGTQQLRQLLLSVDQDVPTEAIERWSGDERHDAQAWAEWAQRKIAAGESTSGGIVPACVQRDATLPIKAEQHFATTPAD